MLADLPPALAPIVQRVRQAVSAELPTGGVDQERIARRLGLSTRTLQRRLSEVETSFQDVLEQTRRDVAMRMLRDRSASVFDVAYMLGYADTPSFYRAFKRWTGQTPQKYRESA